MYILAGLLILRLFQSRHPDINVNAHVAYLCLASVIFLAVIGVVSLIYIKPCSVTRDIGTEIGQRK